MAAISPAVPALVSPASYIGGTIAAYVGDEDGDLVFKKALFQRVFSQAIAPCLDWTERPIDTQEKAQAAFEKVSAEQQAWFTYGDSQYRLCGIDDGQLLRSIILHAPPMQKEFYVLDVGAGDFRWGETIAKFIDEQEDLPKDIIVHILGIRGEPVTGESVITSGRCRQVRLGCFKIEDIHKAFELAGQDVKGKLDMVVSAVTMIHLVDSVGTLVQIHDLLRPRSGLLLIDHVSFYVDNQKRETALHGENADSHALIQLLLDMGSPFLARLWKDQSCRGFIVKKLDHSPCALPMRYGPIREGEGVKRGSASFTRIPAIENPWRISLPITGLSSLCGSRSLFDLLNGYGVLHEKIHAWKPIEACPATV